MRLLKAIVHITDVMEVVSVSVSVYQSEMGTGDPDVHVLSCAATTHIDQDTTPQEWVRDALVSLIEHL